MANTFKSYTTASIGQSTSTIYTVPSGTTTIVIGIALANKLNTGSTVTADVFVDKASGSDVYMIRNVELYDGGSFTLAGTGKIILNTGDKLKMSASANFSVDVIVSVLEQT